MRPFVARRVAAPDVDDVVQDVLFRMARSLSGLKDDERFGPWMYQVARSAIADHWRAAFRHPSADGEQGEELPEPAQIDDDDDDEPSRGLAACVAPFVALLPSPYREALTLTDLEGLTQREAAEMAGISHSGMKSRVQRGRAQLREMLDACCLITLDVRSRVVDFAAKAGCGCPVPTGQGDLAAPVDQTSR